MSNALERANSTEASVVDSLDREFARLHLHSLALIDSIPSDGLYAGTRLSNDGIVSGSIGEYVLRSAGVLEQTFGGLTANLWDDPFEWTLPETLSSRELVKEYLVEVEETRKRAFESLAGDQDLLKKVVEPSGEMRPLISLLLDTLVRALAFHGRAEALRETLSTAPSDGFIISVAD